MNIKSLLIGSAALAVVSTGAQAADAIVIADPEPVEYVRVCDVYGTGFFYIPGTETCLKIGGYVRYEIKYNYDTAAPVLNGIHKRARFAAQFDVRSDTEIGTLRAYAEIEFNRDFNTNRVLVDTDGDNQLDGFGPGYTSNFNPLHVYIDIIRGSHTWRFGKTENPWMRFLGYGLFGSASYAGPWGYRANAEISYTFTGSNGFNFIVALVDDENANFTPDVELGLRYDGSWGHIGIVGRGDFDGGAHGARASLLVRFGNSGVQWKTQAGFEAGAGGGLTAVTGLRAAFTPKFAAYIQGGILRGNVVATLGADITPAAGFLIRPEVTSTNGGFGAALRLQRSF